MRDLPFVLVLISAMAHGYWNFLFKQAGDKDAFLGLSKLVEPIRSLGPVLFFSPFGPICFLRRSWMLQVGRL